MCPSDLGGGCCPNGMGCVLYSCIHTTPSTYIITEATTTTDSTGSSVTAVITYTTIETPSATTRETAGAVPAYVQSTVAKTPAVETSISGGGLNQAQVGGVVGGGVAIFLAVIIAAVLIIHRLRKNARMIEQSQGSSSTANQTVTSFKPGDLVTATVTDIGDSNDIDPLTLEPRIHRPAHLRAASDSTLDVRYPSPARSPGLSSGQSTPPAWPGQYNPVNNSDSGIRHPSLDSTQDGYYDPTRQSQTSRGSVPRTSYDSQTSNIHSRHYSNVSEVSGSADGQHGFSELEASNITASRRRSSSGATKPATAHIRRTSDPHQRGRSDSSTVPGAPLGTLSEINELHGYYGPSDKQVGETAARLQSESSSSTSGK
jgi:hypothetical protein